RVVFTATSRVVFTATSRVVFTATSRVVFTATSVTWGSAWVTVRYVPDTVNRKPVFTNDGVAVHGIQEARCTVELRVFVGVVSHDIVGDPLAGNAVELHTIGVDRHPSAAPVFIFTLNRGAVSVDGRVVVGGVEVRAVFSGSVAVVG